ncbi:tail fiber domain-containing protein [Candidatus Kaiserbacteria bacterium]|nr:tail fiber domain-containing protein [Candidatus Kaiserbacteria bacterium]
MATSTATTTGSQFELRSLRTAIVADNLLGGIDFTSNDTNLTSPGVKVASIQAIANTTHTASVLDTNIIFSGTTGTTLAELMRLTGAGSVGIGTSTPWGKLSIKGSGTGTGLAFAVADSANTPRFVIQDNGNVGIGTTTPTAQFSTTGTVRFAGLGSAGANLVTDALGNVTASSDERLKDKQGDFTRGLDAINAISPVLYKWRPETGFDTQSTYAGFFAQNVQTAIPEAVSPDSRGYLTLADRPIVAALVNAIKELSQQMGDLAARVVTKELIFVRAEGDDLMLNHQLCIRDGATDPNPICLTKSQVAAVLTVIGQGGASSAASSFSSSSTPDSGVVATSSTTSSQASIPPVIEIQGANPATIQIGAVYSDLGAVITGPQESLNLGITTYLDGVETTAFTFLLDTSTSSTHTIDYVVTDQWGQTATATREVVVE